MALEVVHDADARTFRALSDGHAAGRLCYRIWPDGTWDLYSTVVSPAFEGRGIGSQLTRRAVEAAVGAGAPIEPSCWFVAGWLQHHPEALAQGDQRDEDVLANREYWNRLAADYAERGAANWAAVEASWGIFGVPEDELRLLPESLVGLRTVELGCGTGYVSSWLARRGARAVGIDNSPEQLTTARAMQRQHGLAVSFLLGDAQRLPFGDEEFDLAITEYGAVTWCDPHRWVPEAARVLLPGGRLVVFGGSPWQLVCTPLDGSAVDDRLHRPYFGLGRVSWEDVPVEPGGVEFGLTVSGWFELFTTMGFTVDRFIEVPAPADALDSRWVSADWARRYPAEQAWLLTKG